jgi:hypothetical protein
MLPIGTEKALTAIKLVTKFLGCPITVSPEEIDISLVNSLTQHADWFDGVMYVLELLRQGKVLSKKSLLKSSVTELTFRGYNWMVAHIIRAQTGIKGSHALLSHTELPLSPLTGYATVSGVKLQGSKKYLKTKDKPAILNARTQSVWSGPAILAYSHFTEACVAVAQSLQSTQIDIMSFVLSKNIIADLIAPSDKFKSGGLLYPAEEEQYKFFIDRRREQVFDIYHQNPANDQVPSPPIRSGETAWGQWTKELYVQMDPNERFFKQLIEKRKMDLTDRIKTRNSVQIKLSKGNNPWEKSLESSKPWVTRLEASIPVSILLKHEEQELSLQQVAGTRQIVIDGFGVLLARTEPMTVGHLEQILLERNPHIVQFKSKFALINWIYSRFKEIIDDLELAKTLVQAFRPV